MATPATDVQLKRMIPLDAGIATTGQSFIDDEAPEFGQPDSELEAEGEADSTDQQTADSRRREEQLQMLGAGLRKKFADCEQRRQPIEERWLEDLRQFHGKYDPGIERDLTDAQSCTLFLNVTKPKTHAFSARVMDMVLPTDEKNWGISATPVPEMSGMATSEKPAADPTTGQPMQEPTTGQPVLEKDMAAGMDAEISDRADAMEEEIDDQLSEAEYNGIQRQVIEQMSKLGTGVIMGPVILDEYLTKWEPTTDATGKTQYVRKQVPNSNKRPSAQWVDLWNFYPDMSSPDPTGWGFAFVQYLVNKVELRKMGKRFNFMGEPLERVIAGTPFDIRRVSWMNQLRSLSDVNNFTDERYRLLRYYGEIEREDLDAVGMDPDSMGVTDTVFGVVWLCDGEVLKVDINPLDSGELPFSISYCDKDEASPFGIGIPRLMRSEQESVNGAWRMKHDNAGLSVCPQTVMKIQSITPADGDYHMKPKKLWYAADDVQRVSDVFQQFSIDSHQGELDNILQLALRFADDVTQLPLLMQGDQAPNITQTAQGMSLLYNASTVVLRRTVKFYDDYVTIPLIGRFYQWNMQFNQRTDIKGDMRAIARGSSTLLDKEQQGRALDAAMALAMQPTWQPYTDMKKLYQEALKSKKIPDILLPDDKIKENLAAQAAAAQAAQQAKQAPAADPNEAAAKASIENRKLDLMKYDIDSRERQTIASYAAKKDITLIQAQADLASINVKEDHANRRFNADLTVKQAMGSGISSTGSGA